MRHLLLNDQRCRNDDLWLILRFWEEMQQIKIIVPYDKLGAMKAPETITRVRREIQNTEGVLLPTDPNVLMRRQFKEDVVRKYYGNSSPHIVRAFRNRLYGLGE